MAKSRFHPPPKGSISVRQLDDTNWEFHYPRLRMEVYDIFHEALDDWQSGKAKKAEKSLRLLIEGFPEFIDAYHHLAIILDEAGKVKAATELWRHAVVLGMNAFPSTFAVGRDLLQWGFHENRPFLRAYNAWGLSLLERDEVHLALLVFYNILLLNPDDNQGIRAMVVHAHFLLAQPEKVLSLCKKFPGDLMENLLYGRPLALFQLGKLDQARKEMKRAIGTFPLIAEEMLKPRHPLPRNLRSDRITMGGADQAYYYWLEQGIFWQITPGALGLLRECLSEMKKGNTRKSESP